MPSSPRITRTITVRVPSPSTLNRGFMHNARSDLVVAFPLKPSQMFSPNITTAMPSPSPHLRNGPCKCREARSSTIQSHPSHGLPVPVSFRTYMLRTELWRLIQRHCLRRRLSPGRNIIHGLSYRLAMCLVGFDRVNGE